MGTQFLIQHLQNSSIQNCEPDFITLGGIASVALVFLYFLLYREYQEQTLATRASYAPSLDTEVEKEKNHLELFIENNGQGAAKNIKISMSVVGEDREYSYHAKINKTVKPNRSIVYPKSRVSSRETFAVKFKPKFRTGTPTTRLERIKKRLSRSSDEAEVEVVNTKDFANTLSYFPDEYIQIKLNIDYTDITGDKQYHESIWDNVWGDVSEDGFDSAVSDSINFLSALESTSTPLTSRVKQKIVKRIARTSWGQTIEVRVD